MSKVYFLFGIHNHQPAGNSYLAIEEAFEKCYLPFFSVLEEFPKIKCNVHISGTLYDWILENHPSFMDTLKRLEERKQIEIVGGGYYEPLLPIISDEDKFAQIRLMNDFIKKQFGKYPSGLWIAERVWDPHLASIINKAGLKYTFLDDNHFYSAGLQSKDLTGYYITEDSFKSLAVFPINERLRYRIPFSLASEAVGILRSFQRKKEDVLITLFDDGEKFGSWPSTYEWVYEKGWLKKFFSLISQNDKFIETITASEAIKKFSPAGVVYLPNSSYREMDEWVLEPEEFHRYGELVKYINKHPNADKFKKFIRGGFFRNFYRKYPRLNYMHKRMLYLSEKARKIASIKKDKEIFKHIFMSQCSCGYWHGLFGGFYLKDVRSAIYENMIKAEKELERKYEKKSLVMEKADLNLDLVPEAVIRNRYLTAVFSHKGAALLELDYKDRNFNLLNTITRREESYHGKIKGKARRDLVYDKYERLGFIDHLLSKKFSLKDFDRQKRLETLSNSPYKLNINERKDLIELNYQYENKKLAFSKKIIFIDKPVIKSEYIFEKNDILKKSNFAVEFNIFLESQDKVVFYAGKKKIYLKKGIVFRKIRSLKMADYFKGIQLQFDFERSDVFILPVYSICSAQIGVEKVCQQAAILFVKKNKGKMFKVSLNVREGKK